MFACTSHLDMRSLAGIRLFNVHRRAINSKARLSVVFWCYQRELRRLEVPEAKRTG